MQNNNVRKDASNWMDDSSTAGKLFLFTRWFFAIFLSSTKYWALLDVDLRVLSFSVLIELISSAEQQPTKTSVRFKLTLIKTIQIFTVRQHCQILSESIEQDWNDE